MTEELSDEHKSIILLLIYYQEQKRFSHALSEKRQHFLKIFSSVYRIISVLLLKTEQYYSRNLICIVQNKIFSAK